MHITSGTLASVLDTLEGSGYVRRHADPTDRRRVLVDLTPTAQAVLDRLLPEDQQAVTAVMGTLDDQALHAPLDHLTAVRQALAAAPPTCHLQLPAARPPAAPFLNQEHRPDSPRSVPA